MPEARCLLPAVPIALVALVAGAVGATMFGPAVATAQPWSSLSFGTVAAVVVARAVSKAFVTWSEPARRRLGYISAIVVGVGPGGVLAFGAVVVSICAAWDNQCSPDQLTAIESLWKLAFAVPITAIRLYAAADVATLRSRRR